MFVAPTERQVRDEVVVIDEPIIGQAVRVVKNPIAQAGRTIRVNGTDLVSFVRQPDRGQRGHGRPKTVSRQHRAPRAGRLSQQLPNLRPDLVHRLGKSAMHPPGIWGMRHQQRVGVRQTVPDVLRAAESQQGGLIQRRDKTTKLAASEERDPVAQPKLRDPVARLLVGTPTRAGQIVSGLALNPRASRSPSMTPSMKFPPSLEVIIGRIRASPTRFGLAAESVWLTAA